MKDTTKVIIAIISSIIIASILVTLLFLWAVGWRIEVGVVEEPKARHEYIWVKACWDDVEKEIVRQSVCGENSPDMSDSMSIYIGKP